MQEDNSIKKDNGQIEENIEKTHLAPRPNWLVAIVGVAMLIIGTLLGYFTRPLIGPEAQAAKGTATAMAFALETQVESNQKMMEYLTSNTRHFLGEPDAPVTIIEFSDFL